VFIAIIALTFQNTTARNLYLKHISLHRCFGQISIVQLILGGTMAWRNPFGRHLSTPTVWRFFLFSAFHELITRFGKTYDTRTIGWQIIALVVGEMYATVPERNGYCRAGCFHFLFLKKSFKKKCFYDMFASMRWHCRVSIVSDRFSSEVMEKI
jgi:hypothetical protein